MTKRRRKTSRFLTALCAVFHPRWWKRHWHKAAGCLFGSLFALILLFRFVPLPFSAYMVQQKIGHWQQGDFSYTLRYNWVPLENIAPTMQLAVIAAEDQTFSRHYGFDFKAIFQALAHNEKSRRIRGGSTLSQQTVKNLLLWHGQSYVRKGLEVPLTLLLETLWNKRRILEVYLNIAQFGDGIFGVEAAARHYFRKPAAKLTAHEAALLAAVLPNPIIYRADKPSALVQKRRQWIRRQMNNLGTAYLKQL